MRRWRSASRATCRIGVLGEGAAALERAGVHALRTRRGFGHAVFPARSPEQRFDISGGCPDWYLPNAQARGYYRFDMAPADLAKLGGAIAHLSSRRSRSSTRMRSTARSSAAILVPPPCSMRCRRSRNPICRRSRRRCSTRSNGSANSSPTISARAVLDAYATSIYAPRLAELGYRRRQRRCEHHDRAALAACPVPRADGPRSGVRAELASKAAPRSVSTAAARSISRAPTPISCARILKVTVQDDGAPAFDAVQKEFAVNRDTAQRYALLAALGATRDPALG